MDAWFWVWVGLAAVLITAEIFTGDFFMLPFGLGAAVAGAVNYAQAAVGWQWAVFIFTSAVLLGVLRKWGPDLTKPSPQRVGADRLIGECGTVVKALDPSTGWGAVMVGREHWSAAAPGFGIIPEQARVTVVRIEGAHLIVEPADDSCATTPQQPKEGTTA